MRASASIDRMRINDGTTVPLTKQSLVLIVGPNNSGKSQALRDTLKLVTSSGERGVVVESVEVNYEGTAEELRETFMSDRSVIRTHSGDSAVRLGSGGGTQPLSSITSWWPAGAPHIVAGYFVEHADTESRLEASKPSDSVNLYEEDPNTPLQKVYQRRDVEARLDQISREAFSLGLTLDSWSGGDHWAFRVGNIAQPASPRPPQEYLDELKELPLLHQEGDGVRSMMGLLLTLLTGHQTISLIDEPEAFLHPPQAQYLGRLLAQESLDSSSQIMVSTHSREILHGALETQAQTTVLRVTREGNHNRVSVLNNEAVRKLWLDPLLRYSNLLDGLFADGVIVCESEADCKYFAAIKDTIPADSTSQTEKPSDGISIAVPRAPDLLFTNCGGKSRIHTVVAALRAASVPVAVIADFDVLNDFGVVSRIVEAAGGEPEDLRADWNVLDAGVRGKALTPSLVAVQEAVAQAFASMAGPHLTKKDVEIIRGIAKIETGWDRVKNSGLEGVPANDPYQACERILLALAALRIHLVQVGEMEDFVHAAGGHGGAWLSSVLERGLHTSSASDRARRFMADVLASF